ncbi:hypothetical protein AMATHDRAFT_134681 [Amanita thiersii Skay4041]|uniref:Phosphoglycerate mutase-like protein n=1 Tax=Amanita thiersii Skay4041 TaxID=703135 RepID=A0A2A9P1U4_9AGAR|nr:hypothetical protein AMATHDRAFT_134681 [Amanita thiersii Skay4041]
MTTTTTTTTTTPRLILVRHGETDWALNGRHTGRTDIPLTANGEALIRDNAPKFVGEKLVIHPNNIYNILVSPRQRAQKTFHLMFAHTKEPDYEITEDVREWDYGDYEGLTSHEIHKIQPSWSIWTDGCPGGESAKQMSDRVDSIIEKVRACHQQCIQDPQGPRDTIVFAHGHFSRAMIARWLGYPLDSGRHFNIDPGSITILGYAHHSLKEPALDAMNLRLF